MTDDQNIEANIRLDLKGLSCPGPIIGAKRLIDTLAEGQVLLMISDCPGTKDDLYVWAENTGNRVLKAERFADGSTGYYIQRGGRAAQAANITLDMRGAVCPGPILEAKKLIDGMAKGEVLKLISNCAGTRDDVESWTRSKGLQLLDTVQTGAIEYEFYIRKA
jgi:TusA-related sulfurtransferase